MAYAEYEYYKTEYQGNTIPEQDFDRYAAQASRQIDLVTGGKAKYYDDQNGQLKNAMCVVAELYYEADQNKMLLAKNAGKSSETVGRYSVTYRDSSAYVAFANTQAAVNQALQDYLTPTGLLYRGTALVY